MFRTSLLTISALLLQVVYGQDTVNTGSADAAQVDLDLATFTPLLTFSSSGSIASDALTVPPVVSTPVTQAPAPAPAPVASAAPASTNPTTSAPAVTTVEPVMTLYPEITTPVASVAVNTPTLTQAPWVDCSAGAPRISVEGVQGAFCVVTPGILCSGSLATGLCPEPQAGLEQGSYCTSVRTGVYGCRPGLNAQMDPPPHGYETHTDIQACGAGNVSGNVPVSVVGAGTFCTSEPVCSGARFGNCPTAQSGLPSDSKCQIIPSGVYGCVA